MQRRKFIAGLGSAAAAGAAGIGTGAVSQITADRDVNLQIAQDQNAYLGLDAGSNEYVNQAGDGTLTIDFTDTEAGGDGINNRADTVLEDAFTIKNQSDRELYIWSGFSAMSGGDDYSAGDPVDPTSGGARSVELLADGDDTDSDKTDFTFPGADNKSSYDETSRVLGQTTDTGAIKLGTGNSADVDIRLLVYGSGDPRDASFLTVFHAQDTAPEGGSTDKDDHMFTVNV